MGVCVRSQVSWWSTSPLLRQALRQLPLQNIWLPPELRRLLGREDFGSDPGGLLQFEKENEDDR